MTGVSARVYPRLVRLPPDRRFPQRKTPSRQALLRAVASSTAVETGRSVVQLEQRLQQPTVRFPHIKLAR